MGVTTQADLQLDEADEHIQKAMKLLNPIWMKDESVWGADEYSKAYYGKLGEVLIMLASCREKLNR